MDVAVVKVEVVAATVEAVVSSAVTVVVVTVYEVNRLILRIQSQQRLGSELVLQIRKRLESKLVLLLETEYG